MSRTDAQPVQACTQQVFPFEQGAVQAGLGCYSPPNRAPTCTLVAVSTSTNERLPYSVAPSTAARLKGGGHHPHPPSGGRGVHAPPAAAATAADPGSGTVPGSRQPRRDQEGQTRQKVCGEVGGGRQPQPQPQPGPEPEQEREPETGLLPQLGATANTRREGNTPRPVVRPRTVEQGHLLCPAVLSFGLFGVIARRRAERG